MFAKNASKLIVFEMFNEDGSENTTVSPTCLVAKDTGGFVLCANSPVRKLYGSLDTNVFHLTLSDAELNSDVTIFKATGTGCRPISITMFTEASFIPTVADSITNTNYIVAETNQNVATMLLEVDQLQADLAIEDTETDTIGGNVSLLVTRLGTPDSGSISQDIANVDSSVDVTSILTILQATHGLGSNVVEFTSTLNDVPLAGVIVRCYDVNGTQVGGRQVSDDLGKTYWMLTPSTPPVKYTFKQQYPGVDFTDEEEYY